MTKKQKRGYSTEFPATTERRIKREIDKVPAGLDRRLRAKLKSAGISLRALTLTLWQKWVDGEVDVSKEEDS
jgi:hypothetical protein